MKRPIFVALTALAALCLTIACGGSDSKQSQADPAEVLAKAGAASKAVTSFHFRLTHENGGTPIPFAGLQLTEAEGDVAVPERISADVTAKAGPLGASVKLIGIGNQTWITNPFSRAWTLLPNASARDFANPNELIDAIVASLKDPQVVEETKIGDLATVHLRGTMDSGVLHGALSAAQPGHVVTVDLWISPDSLVRRARLAGPITDGEAANIVRLLELSRFNERVDIQPPA